MTSRGIKIYIVSIYGAVALFAAFQGLQLAALLGLADAVSCRDEFFINSLLQISGISLFSIFATVICQFGEQFKEKVITGKIFFAFATLSTALLVIDLLNPFATFFCK